MKLRFLDTNASKKGLISIFRNIIVNCAIITIFYIIANSIPATQVINNLFTDFLQGYIKPRPEIVVVGIDDKSLQKLGAWPWPRDIFARAVNKINESDAAVLGIDVLFLESRPGDAALLESIKNSDLKVTLGTKIVDSDNYKSSFIADNIKHSYINIITDPDGKLRKISPFLEIQGDCLESFSLTIVKEYLNVTDEPNCDSTDISLRDNIIRISNDNNLQFQYTDNSFKIISFQDLLSDSFDKNQLKDKIVLLGSTTIDLRNNLNDNFIDIKGNTIAGIQVHANIINSYLENNFLNPTSPIYQYLFTLLVTTIFLFFYIKSKNDIIYSVSYLVLNVAIVLIGLLLFEFNYNIPVITLVATFTLVYIYSVIYRNIVESIEKKFVKQVFSQYVNPVLLDKIVNQPDLLKLGGEHKEMTIMFSDIRGFTSLSESMTPQELVKILNLYLDKMGQVIDKYNGTIDKFIGDAIMAFWNAPLDDKNHRLNSIKTALDMVDALIEFNKDNKTDFNIGIGINTGNVIVGNLGSTRRFDYTVIGDDVNLASRTEGLTKKYGIHVLLIESTISGLENNEEFILRLVDEVIVKGKTKSVKLYQPLKATEKNVHLKDKYSKAFAKYQNGELKEAEALFSELEHDGPSKLMLNRIRYVENLHDMHGIWKWDEK